ncbi:MAG: hypothetical protein QGI76_08045 [Dehalococcoidia bacterium]|jgi:hypothetical protein|nr:hypothetical protein [Dehalococcoidia bacterium]|tara:strand:+ start:1526 stop:1711 length:186 start_codon:yes stop_codon:yes gene_type:complete
MERPSRVLPDNVAAILTLFFNLGVGLDAQHTALDGGIDVLRRNAGQAGFDDVSVADDVQWD